MFDDLRNESQAAFESEQVKAAPSVSAKRPVAKKKSKKILGMTAMQRFVLATLLFLVVCVLGVALLVVTGKVAVL
jgi:hypothetical protein